MAAKKKVKKKAVKKPAKKPAKKVKAETLTPKEAATAKKEPWISVLSTQVNPENPKNGFFELDWNEHFIMMLRRNGYAGVSDEDVVNQWFGDLCREIGAEEGILMDRRAAGYVDVKDIGGGKSVIS